MTTEAELRDEKEMPAFVAKWGYYTNLVPINPKGCVDDDARPLEDWHVLTYGAGRYSSEWANRRHTPVFAGKSVLTAVTNTITHDGAQLSKSVSVVAKQGKVAGFQGQSTDSYWNDLARSMDMYLPKHSTRCTTGGMRQWLRKLGLSVDWYREWTGFTTLGQWIEHNPGRNLRNFVGLCMEELS